MVTQSKTRLWKVVTHPKQVCEKMLPNKILSSQAGHVSPEGLEEFGDNDGKDCQEDQPQEELDQPQEELDQPLEEL